MKHHRTKNILYIKDVSDKGDINSTLIYIRLVNFESVEYHTAIAKTIKEDEELLKEDEELLKV